MSAIPSRRTGSRSSASSERAQVMAAPRTPIAAKAPEPCRPAQDNVRSGCPRPRGRSRSRHDPSPGAAADRGRPVACSCACGTRDRSGKRVASVAPGREAESPGDLAEHASSAANSDTHGGRRTRRGAVLGADVPPGTPSALRIRNPGEAGVGNADAHPAPTPPLGGRHAQCLSGGRDRALPGAVAPGLSAGYSGGSWTAFWPSRPRRRPPRVIGSRRYLTAPVGSRRA